jgi:beta-aspartyl-peptidase (threonine type)
MMTLAVMTTTLYGAEVSVPGVVLGIHGGTGMAKKEMTPDQDRALRAGLEASLQAGYDALQRPDATSLDGVEAAIKILEDSPYFNAGKGSVFTLEGRNELDASIMEGKQLRAGAVAGLTIVKNPISAARVVMEDSPHVMLVGKGAELFATQKGLEIVDPAYFWTERRWQQHLEDVERAKRHAEKAKQTAVERPPGFELGTVGAVAVDRRGNLAAGTSTGGMSGKRFGRVGDSPVIGAGTYADNASCAVSCTGHGEYFIRYAVAHSIATLMKYRGLSLSKAADEVVNHTLKDAGGEGGIVALDPQGRFTMAYNSEGLYRGYVTADGKIHVFLYED